MRTRLSSWGPLYYCVLQDGEEIDSGMDWETAWARARDAKAEHPAAEDVSAAAGRAIRREGGARGMTINEQAVMEEVIAIRSQQRERWTPAHDHQHESWEWLGLISQYAAQGRYPDAAALCVAAALAERTRLPQRPSAGDGK